MRVHARDQRVSSGTGEPTFYVTVERIEALLAIELRPGRTRETPYQTFCLSCLPALKIASLVPGLWLASSGTRCATLRRDLAAHWVKDPGADCPRLLLAPAAA
jgi:hypothetical protein